MYNINDNIIYEDKYLIVCSKPAGLPVQSARLGQADMESLLNNHIAVKSPGKMPFVGIVHRLDQPVEGLLVFGKSKKITAQLNRMLANGKLEKKYLAVVHGIPESEEAVLEDYLKKDTKTNQSRVVHKGEEGKRSILTYKVLDSRDHMSLLEIRLDTGRHHQIRVQMSAHGCPLAGDRKYGREDGVPNVALCAYALAFLHPVTERRMEYKVKPQGEIFEKQFADIICRMSYE